MKKIKLDAIIFDMDATLVTLGEHVNWSEAKDRIIQLYTNNGVEPQLVDMLSRRGLFNMLEPMYQHLRSTLGHEKAYLVQSTVYDLLEEYEVSAAGRCELMEKGYDLLEWLRDHDVPLGICTSNSHKSAEAVLNAKGISDFFSVVVGRSVDIPMKPHPAQLRRCFELIGANSTLSMMVGDSHKDILAGKALGTYTVGIPFRYTRVDLMKEAGVDIIINSLAELKKIVEK
ncbi:HAD family hydrolase, partial [candidate division WOR-3 bacterium]|nr:HAD family hydrolase [candidate division WOR-3 bacterium]